MYHCNLAVALLFLACCDSAAAFAFKLDRDNVVDNDAKPVRRLRRMLGDGICGQRRYNPTFELCCWGVVNSKSGLKPSCCGTKSYDAQFKLCCHGAINSKSGLKPSCCYKQSYDAQFKMCCYGVINSKSGLRPACCGTKSYDSAFKKCCNGRIC
eukprot:Seg768.2 transcript_id=Seg768.2/GoldUCD/mRNA.D3Y31 product=Galaxin protein_id=Seg768.2/GoldUCD/D3Y31